MSDFVIGRLKREKIGTSDHIITSYAGNREDVLIARAFGDYSGFFVDVGANDPVLGSTTKYLHDRGWRGINIEPNPLLFEKIVRARPDDVNICAVVSDIAGMAPFYVVEDDPALSTMDRAIADNYQTRGRPIRVINVRSFPLDELFEQYVREPEIDLLKIDAEGAEDKILRSANLCRWRPKVLIIEAVKPYEFKQTHSAWEPLVREQGYIFCLFDGVNRIYARDDQLELAQRLCWPVCALDHYVTADDLELAEYRKLGRVARIAAKFVQHLMDARPRRNNSATWKGI